MTGADAAALDQGYFVGGLPPYGYRVENQNLVPDPATAENVPRIFRLFVQLKSGKKVAARLAEEGIKRFPGRAWTLQSVRNCLRNVRYVGDANSHGKVYRLFVRRVTIFETAVELRLNLPVPGAADELEKARYVSTDAKDAGNTRIDDDGLLSVKIPVAFRTVSGRKKIVKDGDGAAKAKPTRRELDETLAQGVVLKSFAKALAWMRLVDEGKAASASQLAGEPCVGGGDAVEGAREPRHRHA